MLAAVGAVILASRRGVAEEASAPPVSRAEHGPAGDGGAGGPFERFAREERSASGDSPLTLNRRVASEEGPAAAPPTTTPS
jgi:hypothetical protein